VAVERFTLADFLIAEKAFLDALSDLELAVHTAEMDAPDAELVVMFLNVSEDTLREAARILEHDQT